MKGTEHFKEIIKGYLDQRAKKDELFRAKYETTARTIDDVVTFILNEVKKSGCCGFADDEIYSLVMHYYDEDDIDIGKPLQCKVVVNHTIVLTEQEKAEARRKAMQKATDEAYAKLTKRNSPKKAEAEKSNSLTLF